MGRVWEGRGEMGRVGEGRGGEGSNALIGTDPELPLEEFFLVFTFRGIFDFGPELACDPCVAVSVRRLTAFDDSPSFSLL